MGTLLWLNLETFKRVPTPLFGRLVRCSSYEHSFKRLQYIEISHWINLHVFYRLVCTMGSTIQGF